MKKFKNELSTHSFQQGFTLIEIMVVVLIIGLLTALIAPNFFNRVDQAGQAAAKADIATISNQLALYRLDNFNYPTTSEGLQALVTNPGKSTWTGYLDSIKTDPWGNPYQYSFPGTNNSNGFDLWSFGRDGQSGGEGVDADIGNWQTQQ